jgi:fumarate hydratase subunit beta
MKTKRKKINRNKAVTRQAAPPSYGNFLRIRLPLTDETYALLKPGLPVLVSGTIYTGRDQAHKRLVEALQNCRELPFKLKDSAIYYTGPSPVKPGMVIGACGPTTSGRMDAYTPLLLDHGLKVMIGKGERSPEVLQAIRQHKAVYFTAIGGLGALLAKCVIRNEPVAYEDLGPEALARLEVADLPCFVKNM